MNRPSASINEARVVAGPRRSRSSAGAAAASRRPPVGIGQRAFINGLWTTALGTLASRALGLVRDMATAALLGESLAMDALVVALRIPNLFRRLFGEGALAACYVPALSEELQRDPAHAWRLTSGLVSCLALGLAGVVVLGETLCAALWFLGAETPRARLILGLTATLLPYLWLICIAAQLAATLQTLGRFAAAAWGAALLNLCWLAGVWWLAPRLATEPAGQAYVVAGCILISGVAQVGLQTWALARRGFRWRLDLAACRGQLARIARALAPLLAGLSVAQLGMLGESLIAWLLAAPEGSLQGIRWLGGTIAYPLRAGAAASLYYAERFYQLPVGLVGVAAATAVFPLLSRHAARNRSSAAASDLGRSLRLTWFAVAPIALGLALLAEPLVRLTLQRGHFDQDATRRAAGMIVIYSAGVWALSALGSLTRACYALGDYRSPARVAIAAAAFSLLLDVVLVWPFAERGLALATSLSAAGQTVWLLATLKNRYREPWSTLLGGLTPTLAAAAALAGCVLALDAWLPPMRHAAELARLILLAGAGASTYFLVAWMLGSRELTILFGGLRRRLAGRSAPLHSGSRRHAED